MPKIPAPGSQPEPTNPEAVEAITPTGDLGVNAPDNLAALRKAAEDIGVDFDSVPENEYGFFQALASGDLDSLGTPGNALAPPEQNPLIPTGDEPTIQPEPTEPLGVTPEPVVEAVEVGLGNDAPEGTEGGGQIAPPSGLEAPLGSPSIVPELIDLGNGVMMTRDEIVAHMQTQNAQQQLTPDELQMVALRRQGLVGYQLVDPATGQPVQQQPAPQQQQQPPPEWLDPVAYQAYDEYQKRTDGALQQILANQRQLAQDSITREQATIVQAIDDARTEFMGSKGMDPQDQGQIDRLDAYLERSGFLAPARDQFPGDPKSAIKAAYGAVYGSVNEYQDYERQRILAEHTASTQEVNQKKAANNAVTSSPGTVSRETTAPKTQEERMAAAASMIENDPQFQSSRGS